MNNIEIMDVIKNNQLLSSDARNRNIDTLHIDKRDKDTLIFDLKFNTLNDLLYADIDLLKKKLANYPHFIRVLYNNEHLLLAEDISRLSKYDMDPIIAFTPIWAAALDTRIINALMNNANINFLGDLINTDYSVIQNTKSLGENAVIKIKKYVHGLGFVFPNETEYISEIIEQKASEGTLVLGKEFQLDQRLLRVLYQNGIFTKHDLLNLKYNIFNLPGHTTITRGLLIEFVQENKLIDFGQDMTLNMDEDNYSESFEVIDKQTKIYNEQIKQRIAKKELLIKQYNDKIEEKKTLLEKEAMLDAQLKTLISEFKSITQESDKGENNVGKHH